MRNPDALPMADAGLEQQARQMFSLDMSPEEYAARHAHNWMCFSLDDYRYADARIERWIHRLGDVLFKREGAPSVDELRRRFLTPEECRAAEASEKEEF